MAGRQPVSSIEDTLRTIEGRVLEEVWIGSGRFATAGGSAVMLALASVLWWRGGHADPVHPSSGVPTVSAALFVVGAVVSGATLVRRRYRWCCAAAYCSALATVAGVGAFWWLRTGRHGAGLVWLVLADVAATALAVCWLTVIVTPIERSQPDMRTRGSSSGRIRRAE